MWLNGSESSQRYLRRESRIGCGRARTPHPIGLAVRVGVPLFSASIELAIEISKSCSVLAMPGASIEVQEKMGH
jgi:hypothetical protein